MKFSLASILTIIGGKLLCNMGGVYKILGYMTGEDIYTHQIPRACRECKPFLLQQYPQLASLDYKSISACNAAEFVEKQIDNFGEELEVNKLPFRDMPPKNPIEELIEMVGSDKVVIVDMRDYNE